MTMDRSIRTVSRDNYDVIDKVEYNLDLEMVYDYVLRFTGTHKKYSEVDKNIKEIECLKVMFPLTFQPVKDSDYTVGSLYVMPVGIGSTTTVGGVGFYCQFDNLNKLKEKLSTEKAVKMDEIIEYWKINDSREKFFKNNIIKDVMGRFVETEFPSIVTTRLSGMFLDYHKLCDNGINGLIKLLKDINSDGEFNRAGIQALGHMKVVIDHLINDIKINCNVNEVKWEKMLVALENIKENKPNSFIEALELTWIYSLLSGVINYGRMDDYLGDYLVKDLNENIITWQEALMYVRTLFNHMEQRRTLANSRVIIGGRGRRNEANADIFAKLAIEAVMANRDIEPQLTLRYYKGMNEDVYNLALDCIGLGTTFPIIYNDDVNISALMNSMGIDEETALKYVPLGCGEINLSGCAVSTPNTCINMLKVLTIYMNDGIDPFDGLRKSGDRIIPNMAEVKTYKEFLNGYKELLSYYVRICSVGQSNSYKYLNEDLSFIYTSLLINDCIKRDKPVLGGGVLHLGGTNETYGNISTGDSLYAIKKIVFEDKKYTLLEVCNACKKDFAGYDNILKDMLALEYYGNDNNEVDSVHVDIHQFICNEVRKSAKKVGMDYYLIVMINNQIGTQWGLDTWASPNGRKAKAYMSNGNNPQSSNDKNGPTAMMNSLTKLTPAIHAGAVQNMKFSKELFNGKREVVKSLLDAYFDEGTQIMVTCVGKEELQDAYNHPEKYPNLVVRVGGFSARFIDLNRNVQKEVLDRSLN